MLPPRLAQALVEKSEKMQHILQEFGIQPSQLSLFFRAFKQEKTLEIWAKNQQATTPFHLIRSYPICAAAGDLGPKTKEGDKQVPEGLYEIITLNPESKYHLSLKINYPTAYDLAQHSDNHQPGGDIYIHGGCESLGCLAMTDEAIEEIFILAYWAKLAENFPFPIHIFPFSTAKLYTEAATTSPWFPFWESLFATARDYFPA